MRREVVRNGPAALFAVGKVKKMLHISDSQVPSGRGGHVSPGGGGGKVDPIRSRNG